MVFEGSDARPERGNDNNNNSYSLSRSSICQRPCTLPFNPAATLRKLLMVAHVWGGGRM